MRIHPVADRILVRRVKEKEMHAGSIVIPETAKEPSQVGVVVAVGPGRVPDGPVEIHRDQLGSTPEAASAVFTLVEKRVYAPPVVKEGDKILFGRFSGMEVKINQEVCFLLRQDEVVAILEAEESELTDVEAKEAAGG